MSVSLLLATPAYLDQVTTQYAQSLVGLARRLDRAKIPLATMFVSDALVTRARNFCVAYFLSKPAFTHLLFIDADVGFPPDLVQECLALDAPVSGAAYPKRMYDFERMLKAKDRAASAADLKAAALEFIPPNIQTAPRKARSGPAARFAKVRHCGTGFMLVRRSVFEEMIAKKVVRRLKPDQQAMRPVAETFYDFFETMITADGTFVGEDYAFCRRWTEGCGGEILVHAEAKLTHSGPATFEGILGASPDSAAAAAAAAARKPKITVKVERAPAREK